MQAFIYIYKKIQKKFYVVTYYGGDFTHGFDTQNYPKLQASLGAQPENTMEFRGKPNPTHTRGFFRVG